MELEIELVVIMAQQQFQVLALKLELGTAEAVQVLSLSHFAQELQEWLALAKEPRLLLVLSREGATLLVAHGCYTYRLFHPLVVVGQLFPLIELLHCNITVRIEVS
jgi:hypothetical protein